ncbi:MAG TPA: hypothetical protein VKL40_14970 [Candidatus Angelobacter sp.]|nr:hypothetical protein [Candidatus Angelobacter sp.]
MNQHSPIRAFVFVIAAVLLLAAASRAQSLGLAPAEVREKFKPGVPFEISLSTSNGGDTPVEMSVQITDLWYNEKNEKVFSDPGTAPRSAANWIQFVPEHFAVAAHGTQKMRAIVTPPADAKGGYYATLFVMSKPQLAFDKTKDGRQVYTNMRLGCLVLLTAENTEQLKLELSNVKLTPPTANQGLELTFDLLNAGNSHIFPVARLAILDARRKLVAKADSKEKRFLPGQKDGMQVSWAGSLPPGDYSAILTVSYGEDRIETQQIPFSAKAP